MIIYPSNERLRTFDRSANSINDLNLAAWESESTTIFTQRSNIRHILYNDFEATVKPWRCEQLQTRAKAFTLRDGLFIM